jgi:hypothetical protein
MRGIWHLAVDLLGLKLGDVLPMEFAYHANLMGHGLTRARAKRAIAARPAHQTNAGLACWPLNQFAGPAESSTQARHAL